MGISRSHASRTKLRDDLTYLTKITFPVFLKVGNVDYMNPVGTISVSSSHEAFGELANLLRAIADEIDPGVVTVVREDTETAMHGRPVEDVDVLADPGDRRDQ